MDRQVKFLTFLILVLPAIPSQAQENPATVNSDQSNWTGQYTPCSRHDDLLNHNHLDLAVRISTANKDLAKEFENALEFWSGVLDLKWHEVDADAECSMQLVDGTPSIFNFCVCMSARSQLPDREGFQGWIAFNPRYELSKDEMFLDSVHEIGHVLGLAHNADQASVMSSFGSDVRFAWLDAADLDALALHHTLRPGVVDPRARADVFVRAPDTNVERARRGF